MTLLPKYAWPFWVLFGAVLVLVIYPLSLGPLYWLMLVLPRQGWSPVSFDTLESVWRVYSYPANLAGGVPTNRFGFWLNDYINWWHALAVLEP